MQKRINIPFFGKKEEIIMSIDQIRNDYLAEFDIIGSELTKQMEEIVDKNIPKIV